MSTKYSIDAFKPINDKILVLRHQSEEATQSGIVIPHNAQHPPLRGTVLSVGPDVTAVQPGDVVSFPSYAGAPLDMDHIESHQHIILKEKELFGFFSSETFCSTD